MPASRTEPTVGALLCASGSQVCTGTSGTFTARPTAMRMAAVSDVDPRSSSICRLFPLHRDERRNRRTSRAEPTTVYSRNLVAARRASSRFRSTSPQRAMTNHIGMSANSKKMKKSSRSWATNTPSDAPAMTMISATSAGEVSRCQSHTQHASVRTAVSSASGHEISSTPTWKRAPIPPIHGWSISAHSVPGRPIGMRASSTSATRDATVPSSAAPATGERPRRDGRARARRRRTRGGRRRSSAHPQRVDDEHDCARRDRRWRTAGPWPTEVGPSASRRRAPNARCRADRSR